MALQKRLYYGSFDGYQAPPIPRATRSLRRRGPLIGKKAVDNQMYAFDLLATVADKILLEGQIPATNLSDVICQEGSNLATVKEERLHDDHKLLNIESCNQISSEIGLALEECGLKAHNQPDREITNHQGGFSSGSASAITTSGCKDKTGFDEKNALNDGSSHLKKLEGCSSGYTVLGVPIEDHGKKQFQSHIGEASYGVGSDTCSSEDPKLLDWKLSDKYDTTDAKVHVHQNHYTCGLPSPCRNNVNLVIKDDDDNSFECSQRRKVMKTIGDRRIRKLLASRCWRAPPKVSNRDPSNTGVQMHAVCQNRKRSFKSQRSQRMYPFKKRKLLYSLPSISDGTTRSDYEDIYEPLEKATGISASDFGASGHGATSELSEAAGQSTLFASRESNVKLKIKSFRVPELFIELPETATVGSLKTTVMDAITTLLGGGLHIGVLLQGRKIRDDNRTLLQTGISHDNKLDTIGFTLEPNPSRVITPLCSKEPSVEVPQPLSSSYAESSIEKGPANSREMVSVPETNVRALAVVPPPLQKSKRSEAAQRRIRRPFSVFEVEALVQAVEKLGTGRWRDVKLRAFDDANHRTYVDLKDKWKTLVHTATISPQQRRGEPVPQELLDRVLAAHSHWSQQHAKQQPELCLLV